MLGLTMVQGVQQRILRSRGRGIVLTAKLRYRDGLRMLEGTALTVEEAAVLAAARSIVADFLPLAEAERFQALYDWVCRNIRYVHTAPGRKGYEALVGAAGALRGREANCQGFADVLYLLCGLAGIACEYRIGRGERQLHAWNAVCIGGGWRDVDASKGARALPHPLPCKHGATFPNGEGKEAAPAREILGYSGSPLQGSCQPKG